MEYADRRIAARQEGGAEHAGIVARRTVLLVAAASLAPLLPSGCGRHPSDNNDALPNADEMSKSLAAEKDQAGQTVAARQERLKKMLDDNYWNLHNLALGDPKGTGAIGTIREQLVADTSHELANGSGRWVLSNDYDRRGDTADGAGLSIAFEGNVGGMLLLSKTAQLSPQLMVAFEASVFVRSFEARRQLRLATTGAQALKAVRASYDSMALHQVGTVTSRLDVDRTTSLSGIEAKTLQVYYNDLERPGPISDVRAIEGGSFSDNPAAEVFSEISKRWSEIDDL